MKRLSFSPGRPTRHVRHLAGALKHGPALVPALGGMVALGRGPEELSERFGAAYRLVATGHEYDDIPRPTQGFDFRVRRALEGPVVGRFDVPGGWSGLARADEPLLEAFLKLVPEAGIGLPDEEQLEEMLDRGSASTLLAGLVPPGPGPTVVDLRQHPVRVEKKGALPALELEARLGEPVQFAPGLVFSVFMVCTGNMCRSALAHGILARMLKDEKVFVYSAGTDAPAGSAPPRETVAAAAELGVDISGHRAQQLYPDKVAGADLVLVMEQYHRRRVLKIAPDAGTRVRLLGAYLPGSQPDREIGDPVGWPLRVHRQIAAEINIALERVAAEVRERLVGPKSRQ